MEILFEIGYWIFMGILGWSLVTTIIIAVVMWRKDPEREWDRKWKAIKKAERERKRQERRENKI